MILKGIVLRIFLFRRHTLGKRVGENRLAALPLVQRAQCVEHRREPSEIAVLGLLQIFDIGNIILELSVFFPGCLEPMEGRQRVVVRGEKHLTRRILREAHGLGVRPGDASYGSRPRVEQILELVEAPCWCCRRRRTCGANGTRRRGRDRPSERTVDKS